MCDFKFVAGSRGSRRPFFSPVLQWVSLALLAGTLVHRVAAAAGDLDPLNLNILGGNVGATAVQPDGKIIVAGNFTNVLGVPRNYIARINANGTLDTGFDPKPDKRVFCVAVQADGKVLLGGDFETLQPNGGAAISRYSFARVNADGTLDTGFDPSPNFSPYSIALQADGKIVIGGYFTTLQPNGGGVVSRNRIARLNADGTLDLSFDPNANNTVFTVAVQPDGKVLVGGIFSTLQPNGGAVANRKSIARVNTDGTLDIGFDPNPNFGIQCVAVQGDGKVLLGGNFTTLQPNGAASPTTRHSIARVNSDGTLDTGFDPKPNVDVLSIVAQADGKVLLGGAFTTLEPNGGAFTNRSRIARVNADGTLDTSFDPRANGFVYSVAVQADGRVLLGGIFTTLQPNGALSATSRNLFARLLNDPATQNLSAPNASQISWTRGGSSPEVSQVTFELSTNGGGSWIFLGDGVRAGVTANWQRNGVNLPGSGQLRARGRTSGGGYGSQGLVESVTSFSGLPVPEIAVRGNSVDIADGDNAPSTTDHTDFGTVNVIAGTVTRLFTVTNSGTTNLTLGIVSIGGAHATDFSVTAQPASIVAINSSTTFQITFNPVASGLRSATVSISNNDSDENPYNFSIQGTGAGSEIDVRGNGISISDGSSAPSAGNHTDFGNVDIAGGTLVRTFTIANSGTLIDLALGSVTISGAHAADFTVNAQPTSPVATNGSTTFQVTFNPSALGLRSAALSFTNNDPNENPFNFNIQGTGGSPEIAVAGNNLNIADGDTTPSIADDTDFGGVVAAGATSVYHRFAISNTGTATLTLSNVILSGPHAGDFILWIQPASSVPTNGTAEFFVIFDPTAGGLRSATLTFTNSDSNENPFNFNIQGTGLVPEIAVTGNSLNITNSDSSPSIADHTDFGSANIAGGTVVRTFTITNLGSTTLSLGTVMLSGAHASNFVVTAQPTNPVAANGSTTFQIAFDPIAIGLWTVVVNFSNNDTDESPFTFRIQGTGLGSEIAVSGNGANIDDGDNTASGSDHTHFGSINVIGSTVVRTFTITNGGNLALSLGAVTVSGANAGDFVVTTQPATSVAANGSTTFQITFDPSANGSRSAALSFTNNDADENPFNFSIEGFGIAAPEVAVLGNGLNIADGDTTPSTADHTDFGSMTVTNGTIVRTFTITNMGATNLTIGTVGISGPNSGDFAVTAQPATNLPPNVSTTFQVTFNPNAGGLRMATASFLNNDSDEGAFSFDIQGTGLAPEIAVLGNGVNIVDDDITPSVTDHTDFGGVAAASGTVTRTFTITNSGGANLTVGSVIISGPQAADYTVTAQPAAVVAPNGSTTFQVTFDPPAVGLRDPVALSFSNNDSDENPFNFYLRGTGLGSEIAVNGNGVNIADGDISPSAADHTDFGSVGVSGATLVRTFTITNSGNTNLTLGVVTVGGTHAADFSVNTQPAINVAAGSNTTFQVTFNPNAIGLRSATLSFTNNDADENPFNFSIQGTGISPELAVIGNGVSIVDGDSTPDPADFTDFGSADIAGASIVRTFTITNSGPINLTLGTLVAGGDFSVTTQPTSLVVPSGSTMFQITFNPSALGLRSATLSFTNNDSDENPFSFSIQGTGTTPEIAVSGNNVNIADGDGTPSTADHTDFGGVAAASGTVICTFTITNSSTASLALGNVVIGGTHAADFNVNAQPASSVVANGSATFQITFNPGAFGLRSATLSFTNNDADENPFNYNIQGTGTNTAPTVSNLIPDQGATEDIAFSFAFAANTFADVDAGNVFTYSATNVPAWLTFTPATRTFGGTPTDANVGFADITVVATDNGAPPASVSEIFRITVTNVNDAPVFTKGANQSHPFGTTNTQTLVAWATGISDGDITVTQALTFNVTNSNAGLFAALPTVASNGTLTYRLNGTNGVATIGVTLTDDATAGGAALTSAVQTFTITVDAPSVAVPPVIDLRSLKMLGDGSLQFSFTNTNNTTFSVLAATNITLSASNWTVIGVSTNIGGGRYGFTDPATNFPVRFYRLRYP